jgi:hypothetical protein
VTEGTDRIVVNVKYKDMEQTFSADRLEDAWLLLNKFFHEAVPSFEMASKLWLDVDLKKLATDLEGVVAFSPEGANLLLSKSKLTDNETLILWLLASHVGHKLGGLQSDSLSKEELQAKLGKSGKITSTRLGELVKNDLAARTSEDKFKITTFGAVQVQKDILPKIKAKMSS